MNRKNLKISLIGLGAAMIASGAVATSIVLTSCSDDNNGNGNGNGGTGDGVFNGKHNLVSFNAKVSSSPKSLLRADGTTNGTPGTEGNSGSAGTEGGNPEATPTETTFNVDDLYTKVKTYVSENIDSTKFKTDDSGLKTEIGKLLDQAFKGATIGNTYTVTPSSGEGTSNEIKFTITLPNDKKLDDSSIKITNTDTANIVIEKSTNTITFKNLTLKSATPTETTFNVDDLYTKVKTYVSENIDSTKFKTDDSGLKTEIGKLLDQAFKGATIGNTYTVTPSSGEGTSNEIKFTITLPNDKKLDDSSIKITNTDTANIVIEKSTNTITFKNLTLKTNDSTGQDNSNQSDSVVDLDPSTNENAKKKFKELIKGLTKDDYQKEIKNGLLQFFQANEYEEETSSSETEAEIKSITVNSVEYKENDINTKQPFGVVNLTADITFKVETENDKDNDKDDDRSISIRDKDETVKTETLTNQKITLIPNLAGQDDINAIVTQLNNFKANIGNDSNKKEILKNLSEIYFGDKDKNDKFDIDDLWDDDKDDDKNEWENKGGVLNYLNNFINNVNPFAKMAGWKVDISQVSYQKPKAAANPIDPLIWAPSSQLNTIFYPVLGDGSNNGNKPQDNPQFDKEPSFSKIFKIDLKKFSVTKLSDWLDCFGLKDTATGKNPISNSNISAVITKLNKNGAFEFIVDAANVTSMVIDMEDFNNEREIEFEFIVKNKNNKLEKYELDIQASWFKK